MLYSWLWICVCRSGWVGVSTIDLCSSLSARTRRWTPSNSRRCAKRGAWCCAEWGRGCHFEMLRYRISTANSHMETRSSCGEKWRGRKQIKQILPVAKSLFFCSLQINTNLGRYVLTSTGDLQIVQVHRSDSGTYVCVADNGIGAPVQREVQLNIAGRNSFISPFQLSLYL